MKQRKQKLLLQIVLLLGIGFGGAASAMAQSGETVAKLENLEDEILVDLRRGDARKFDEYGQITSNDEKARLDSAVIELQNSPTVRMYVVVSGKTPAIVKARMYRVSNYAIRMRGLDPSRLVVITRPGKREPNTQIWFVPPGAEPPR